MTSPKEQFDPNPNISEYYRAEQIINQTLADMEEETHIEYGSTMERKAPPPKWKKWLHRLLRLRN